MSTITTIQATDGISSSRTDINTNFSNLNSDKIETSYLDTDTTLAANSDTKIPTQKAVKAYVDAGGNVNASETTRGIVEEATDAEVTAGTATGSTGAKLFVTPAKLATRLSTTTAPIIRKYDAHSGIGGSTTRFDITNTLGTTYRYTFDGTGTDPGISAATFPVGTGVNIQAQNFNGSNTGFFTVTGSGTNYFEVTNSSGVAESDKTIGTGYITKGEFWTKPTGLTYIIVELVGGGGGAYTSGSPSGGRSSYFKANTFYAGGGGAAINSNSEGNGGSGNGGDINISGTDGTQNYDTSSGSVFGHKGLGGVSALGSIGKGGDVPYTGTSTIGATGGAGGYTKKVYGASSLSSSEGLVCGAGGTGGGSGESGSNGIVIITEFYS